MTNNRSRSLQRVGPLADLPACLAEFGVSFEAVAAGSNVSLEDLAPDNRIPLATACQLLETSAALTGCPHFGLRLGARQDHRCLGLLGRLMAHAPTLNEALRGYVGVQSGYSEGAVAYLMRIGSDVAFGFGVYDRWATGSQQLYGVALAVGCNMIRALSAQAVQPTEILIGHRRPADRRPYEEILRAPIRFDQNQTCVVLRASALDAPVAGADPQIRARLLEQLRGSLLAGAAPATARVKHLLRPQLLRGRMSMAATAAEIGIHPRSLRRQLAREGTRFDIILDEVRFAVAQDILELTDLPVGEVASAVSYGSHSSFATAFRRWSGMSPSEWRGLAAG